MSVTTLATRSPGEVTYATASGKRSGRARVTTTQAVARLATSLAPPEPTRKRPPESSVEFRRPSRSTSAAPRQPTVVVAGPPITIPRTDEASERYGVEGN